MRKLLVFLGAAWIATQIAGALVSVDHERPYDLSFLDEPGVTAKIGDDWLHGWGTGLAMPLGVLAAAAILTVLVSFGGGWGRLGAFLMMVVGGLSIGFTLTNQVTYDRLDAVKADRVETGLIVASLGLAGLLVVIGLVTVITTPRARRR